MNLDSNNRRVVVTGYGMITPLGRDSGETFGKASSGASGIDYIRSFDTSGLPCRIGGEIDDSWVKGREDEGDRRFYKLASRALRLMLIATREATALARLYEIPDRGRIGVALGSHGDNPSVENMVFLHRYLDGNGRWDLKGLMNAGGYSYLNFFRRKPDAATSILSITNNCKGPNISIVSACAAGAQAIGEACRIIREGRCDAMVAGGCEATLTFTGFVGFVLLRALAERYSTPEQASRPFDRRRSGFIMSEGAGALVLEELKHARARGANILGEILGYGDSADAYRITDTHPKGEGAKIAMRKAIEEASLKPSDIEYINAHGTSTVQNDLTETRAIKEVFGARAKEIPVSSNKSMLGHTIAAAGAIECILTLMGMEHSIVLPTINYEHRDPRCDLDYVPNEARKLEHSFAISNSFGFGGQNACLCIGRFGD
ncbi:3-oxoacyl-[acyl-carrier-protein] synthase 2 [bacterium BMS3Bbin06]|nr:3-oxoacyl-[acyl-carrier-protein] synthase 2 [bacterium BMS3Bbin06]